MKWKLIFKHENHRTPATKKIGDELFISERTVETHRKIFTTNTKGEAAWIEFIKKHNLIN
jgi:hypothetical protein